MTLNSELKRFVTSSEQKFEIEASPGGNIELYAADKFVTLTPAEAAKLIEVLKSMIAGEVV
jgi:hypothetical protein